MSLTSFFLVSGGVIFFYLIKKIRIFMDQERSVQAVQKIFLSSAKTKTISDTHTFFERLDQFSTRWSLFTQINNFLRSKSLPKDISVSSLLLLSVVVIFVSFNIASFLDGSVLLMVLFSQLVQWIAVSLFIFTYKPTFSFHRYLPEFLEQMARAYSVHPDLASCLYTSVGLIPDERIKQKMMLQIRLSRFGICAIDSLERLARTTQDAQLDFVVRSLRIFQPLGVNISVLFGKTAQMIRAHTQTIRQVQSTMFQNQLSAIIVCLLVPALVVFAAAVSDQYRQILFLDPSARIIFVGALIWWCIGVAVVVRTSRLRI